VLSEVAQWRDAAGDLLSRDVAAVELLNLLRPVVAIGRFIAFGALALHVHPQWRDHVIAEPTARMAFGAEVRRTAPFFPLMAGRARHPLSWHGTEIARGDHVVIDLFATNRHPDEWSDASRFDPGRFLHGGADTRRIVAQGAGDMVDGHRCPGEPSTAQLLESAVLQLARSDWTLRTRDLHTDLRRIPALPGSSDLNVLWAG
jgi:fatty-acid peroxygenase